MVAFVVVDGGGRVRRRRRGWLRSSLSAGEVAFVVGEGGRSRSSSPGGSRSSSVAGKGGGEIDDVGEDGVEEGVDAG